MQQRFQLRNRRYATPRANLGPQTPYHNISANYHYISALTARLGIKILKSPPQSPTANAICERVIGRIRRECLDWLIPMSEEHLRATLNSWVNHYNSGRPHMSLGPGVPDPPSKEQSNKRANSRHHLGEGIMVRAHSVVGGLHHEYSLAHSSA